MEEASFYSAQLQQHYAWGIRCSFDYDGIECMYVGSSAGVMKTALQAYPFYNIK